MAGRETQRKGDIATTTAILVFTKLGYDVSIPVTESAAYDIIVDTIEDGLKRVQVKYTISKNVDLRKIHTNSTGYVVKKNKANAYDWLFVYNPDKGMFLVKECPPERSYIALNNRFKLHVD